MVKEIVPDAGNATDPSKPLLDHTSISTAAVGLEFSTTSKEFELPPSDTRSDDPAFTVIAGRSSSTVILGNRIILNI
jgi:hypothetical protein